MKNPGCANSRGSPPYISRNSSYQIPPSPNAPAAMILKAKTASGDDDGSTQFSAFVQISTFLSGCLHSFRGLAYLLRQGRQSCRDQVNKGDNCGEARCRRMRNHGFLLGRSTASPSRATFKTQMRISMSRNPSGNLRLSTEGSGDVIRV